METHRLGDKRRPRAAGIEPLAEGGKLLRGANVCAVYGDRTTEIVDVRATTERFLMPKTTKQGKPKKEELPDTLKRSPEKAQRTYAKAHDSAAQTYGEGERAHRTAYSALKHTHERKGDRWVPKDDKGPSDPRAKDPKARERSGSREGTPTYGGVDVEGNTKEDLYERAKDLGVPGRSNMSKEDLAEAVSRKQG